MKKFFKSLDLRFQDTQKENEYVSIKKQILDRDFLVTLTTIFLIILTSFLERVEKGQNRGAITGGVGLAILLFIVILRYLYKGLTLHVTILLVFAYNLYRLILMYFEYQTLKRLNYFFSGYNYAVLFTFLLKCIPTTYYRIWVALLAYCLRWGLIILLIDESALKPGSMVRGAIVDLFILYYCHSAELVERRIFKSFDQKRDEILKFKELVSDSLPLGITVINCKTLKPSFSNTAFITLFTAPQSPQTKFEIETINSIGGIGEIRTPDMGGIRIEASLRSLFADEASIRDFGKEQQQPKAYDSNKSTKCLEDVLKELIREDVLADKALSLTALERVEKEKERNIPRLFDVTLRKINWEGNDSIAVVLNDITYQEKLLTWKMANANKDKIIATVSHELRTPLHGIIGLLDMTEKKVQDNEALELISLCRDNAHLLMNLVNSLLDLHQISAGKLKLVISKVDIRKCLQDVLRLFQFQTNKKKISLTFNVSEEVPALVKTDENRLKQILINLIGNAIKFTSEGGVRVLVENLENLESSSFLRFSVTDTGIGIQEEDKHKLFQMYGKLADGESVNKNGVGLGLTIANALAVMLSGNREEREIDVVSEYGKGSTFCFKIQKDLRLMPANNDETTKTPNIIKGRKATLFEENNNKIQFCLDSEGEDLDKKEQKENISNTSIDLEPPLDLKLSKYRISKAVRVSLLNSVSSLDSFTSGGVNNNKETIIGDSNFNPVTTYPMSLPSTHRETNPLLGSGSGMIPSQRNGRSGEGSILIVDDNPFNLLVAENLVKEIGYPVKTASGGYEAINKMEEVGTRGENQGIIKAILMDCQMPVIDGYETTRILVEMMRSGKVPKVPILALTANNSKEDIRRCYESGMVGHLMKPTSKASLLDALSKL